MLGYYTVRIPLERQRQRRNLITRDKGYQERTQSVLSFFAPVPVSKLLRLNLGKWSQGHRPGLHLPANGAGRAHFRHTHAGPRTPAPSGREGGSRTVRGWRHTSRH